MLSLHDDPLLAEIPEIDGFKVLEPCVLYSKLGEGGMGSVYRGRHLNLDIDVAVKCLRRSLADQGAIFVQRFQREARLAAGIHHQNLVQVYDVSQKGGVHYLVMEFVSGETARDRVRRKGKLGIEEAMRIAFGAASGLKEAHARRIVHRDVKPDNILIGRDGSVKVSDLGLAKALEGELELSLTQGVMGTPQYMAPEQWEDSATVTPAADVWALGATIYYLLAGTDPIKAGSMQQALKRICFEPFPDIRAVRPEVPDDVVQLIERCVARSTADRFADCGEVLAEIKRFVGRDQGELIAREGEMTQMGANLVSPPPPATMAKIRLQIETHGGSKSKARPKPAELAPTLPMQGAAGAARSKRLKLALVFGGSAAVVALGLFFALRGNSKSKDKLQPLVFNSAPADLPSAPTSMRVRFDAVADARAGYLSATRKFALTGVIEGTAKDFKASIREKGGDVSFHDQGSGRFRLDFRFDHDGKFELGLEGLRLEEPKTMSITIDATGPALATHEENPEPPLERGSDVRVTLHFDEELKSAVIDGREANIQGRDAQVSARAPEQGKAWSLSWKAVDLMGNESARSITLALEPVAAIPDSPAPVVRQDPTPVPLRTPTTTPVDAETPAAPLGCVAVGKEALEFGGRRWAKRVRHLLSGINLVLIPPGSFQMGAGDKGDHPPTPRTVTITHGFYMSEDEVSQAEYAAVLHTSAPSGSTRWPYSGLSWAEADSFCNKAKLDLPSEAEWEYACRAGSDQAFSFGNELQASQGATIESGRELRPCGNSERNKFGLADMHGNLKEYCRDGFLTAEAYAKLPATDPVGRRGKARVLRGGSYQSLAKFCTSAARQDVEEKQKQLDRGLRVILKID